MLGSKRIPIRARNVGSNPIAFQKTSLISPEPHSGTKDASAPGYARNRKPLARVRANASEYRRLRTASGPPHVHDDCETQIGSWLSRSIVRESDGAPSRLEL